MGRSAKPSSTLAPYVRLTELLVSGRIDALQFDSRFREEFPGLRRIPDADFAVLNELFFVVEDFVPDVDAREPGDATDQELPAAAKTFSTTAEPTGHRGPDCASGRAASAVCT
ncbi:colicin immunity domain-containing protein [Streptomyces sp. NPDC059897]|uniref:colicin immunity domain-containing protein n=1 Tax=Streptomyces sp. NPDC059897 TaxID=3346994 RepID=UPI003668E946